MGVNLRLVLVFVSGVAFGISVFFLNLLTIVDKTGRVRTHSLGFYEFNNITVLRQEHDSRRVASELKVRVACCVLTCGMNRFLEALAVKNTWGRRCDKLIFISSRRSKRLEVLKVDIPEGRDYLWNKTKACLRYVYENHLNDTDWFLKTDDDTYIIMENLQTMLAGRNTSDLVYLGHSYKTVVKQGYMSGGSGYVLSRTALKLVVEKGMTDDSVCTGDSGDEDVDLGFCLEELGVPLGDSRDQLGRERFFPILLNHYLDSSFDRTFWLWNYSYHGFHPGLGSCSPSAISFHYITPPDMYLYEYLIYYLQVAHRAH